MCSSRTSKPSKISKHAIRIKILIRLTFSVEKNHVPNLRGAHTHTDRSKATPESLRSAGEKMSINTSVGLPRLEHVTVSLVSGCVNLFCLVCCESVYSLKQRSMPTCFFSPPRWLCGAQSFGCLPSLSVARPQAHTDMEYNIESYSSQTISPAISCGAALRDGIGHRGTRYYENFFVLQQASWADWYRPVPCFYTV